MDAQTRLDPCEVIERFPGQLQSDARALYRLLRSVTGHEAVMWGPSVIGFGEKVPVCVDDSSPDGFEIGFSRRDTTLVLVLRRYSEYYAPILDRLGSVPFGRNAIVLPAFDDLDESVLRELIETAWEDRTRAD